MSNKLPEGCELNAQGLVVTSPENLDKLIREARIKELALANTELYKELGLNGSSYLRDRIKSLEEEE